MIEICGQKIDTLDGEWHLFVLADASTGLKQIRRVAYEQQIVRTPHDQAGFSSMRYKASYSMFIQYVGILGEI